MIGIGAGIAAKRSMASLLVVAGTLWHGSAMAQADDWKKVWDQTVAAAGKEGQLVISAPSGTEWREQLLTFQQSYPGIKLSITAAASRDYWPRVIKEREAKLGEPAQHPAEHERTAQRLTGRAE